MLKNVPGLNASHIDLKFACKRECLTSKGKLHAHMQEVRTNFSGLTSGIDQQSEEVVQHSDMFTLKREVSHQGEQSVQ